MFTLAHFTWITGFRQIQPSPARWLAPTWTWNQRSIWYDSNVRVLLYQPSLIAKVDVFVFLFFISDLLAREKAAEGCHSIRTFDGQAFSFPWPLPLRHYTVSWTVFQVYCVQFYRSSVWISYLVDSVVVLPIFYWFSVHWSFVWNNTMEVEQFAVRHQFATLPAKHTYVTAAFTTIIILYIHTGCTTPMYTHLWRMHIHMILY